MNLSNGIFCSSSNVFVYLTILTSQHIGNNVKASQALMNNAAGKAAVGMIMSNNEILAHLANLTILLGMLFGGIFVANKLGIAGGNIGMSLAQKVGKGAGAWAGRKTWGGIKMGTGGLYNRAIDKMGLRDKSIEASNVAAQSGRMGKLWYGLKARTYANLSAPTERAVGKYESDVSKLTITQAMAQSSTAVGAKAVALNEYLAKNTHKILPMMVGGVDKKQDWIATNLGGTKKEALYKRYNTDYGGTEKKIGMSAEAADAYNAKDMSKFGTAMDKFIVKLKKSDALDTGKAWKNIFDSPSGDAEKFAKEISKSLGKKNPQLVSSLLPHLGGAKVVNNFSNIYKESLKDEGLSDELERFEKTIFNNYKNFEGGAPTTTETVASTTPKS